MTRFNRISSINSSSIHLQSQNDRQKRIELAMVQAQLRQVQTNEENLRIAEESRLADLKLKQDREENKQKKGLFKAIQNYM